MNGLDRDRTGGVAGGPGVADAAWAPRVRGAGDGAGHAGAARVSRGVRSSTVRA